MVPLFSIRSSSGWGVGDIADIPRFATWAKAAGFSVLQLLPVNEGSGADPSPYAPVSAFALDPVYLSLADCTDFVAAGGISTLSDAAAQKLQSMKESPFVDWPSVRAVKREAIAIAFDRFMRDEWLTKSAAARQLVAFINKNAAWLDDYALFSVWHDHFGKSWLDWPAGARDRDPGAIALARDQHRDALLRAKWVQFQLDTQWRKARREASAAGVELMGDLPFVVGMDSADVWSNRSLFRTDRRVGTPPDDSSPSGQDWGLPVYDWTVVQRENFAWIRARAMRAGSLFSLFRVDHAVGFYRTYFRSVDDGTAGFTPADESEQVALGESLMRLMSRWGEVIAEDLGAVPPFLRPSLQRLGVSGTRVLRWEKDGEHFRSPASWPAASVATNATHDTETSADWYERLSREERERLREVPGLEGIDPDRPWGDRERDLLLQAVYAARSILALVPFQDAMGTRDRINVPGTVSATNWSYRMAKSVDDLLSDTTETERLAHLAAAAGRAP
ncbi:MAG: 4-alpha-glucanotransferase [Polyangiaceae bacterium]